MQTKFYFDKWSNYESVKSGTFRLLPSESRIEALKKDYKAMGNMIFDKQLSFDEIIKTLQKLEDEINRL